MNERQIPTSAALSAAEAAQARIAQRVSAALSELLVGGVGPDVQERLRFAREQALARARQARAHRAATATVPQGSGTLAVGGGRGGESTPWWLRFGALAPLAVLVAGLVLIDSHYTRSQIEAAAELDSAILADDLPPEAYRDGGFVEFLKTARQ